MLSNLRFVFTNKLFYIFIGLIFIIPFLYKKLPIRIDITQQSSLPYKLWLTYEDLSIESDYILFLPPISKYISNLDAQYLKKIVCKENDFLDVNEKNYFCNGKYIGTATKYDGNKNEIDNFKFNGIIPKDKFFVVGTHPLSHDSKYFGFVDKSQILRKAIPLF